MPWSMISFILQQEEMIRTLRWSNTRIWKPNNNQFRTTTHKVVKLFNLENDFEDALPNLKTKLYLEIFALSLICFAFKVYWLLHSNRNLAMSRSFDKVLTLFGTYWKL